MTEPGDPNARQEARHQVETLRRLVESSGLDHDGLRAALLVGDPGELWWTRAREALYGPEAGRPAPSTALKLKILTACGRDSADWPDLFAVRVAQLPPPKVAASNRASRYIAHQAVLPELEIVQDPREFNALLLRLKTVYDRSYRDIAQISFDLDPGLRLAPSTLQEILNSSRLLNQEQLPSYLIAVGVDPGDCAPWTIARDRIAAAPPAVPVLPPPADAVTEPDDRNTDVPQKQRRWALLRGGRTG